MQTEQTNRVTMFKTVDAYFDDNISIWGAMPLMQAAVTQHKTNLTAIDRAAQLQEIPSGAADDKAAARDALEDVLFLICEALGVLGHTGNDHDLAALAGVTRTSLDRFDEEKLTNRATNVLAEANARKTALAGLNITQANLDELTQALARFNQSKANPRTATAEKKVQTQTLAGLIRATSSHLRNPTDRLVNMFLRSHPEFVAGYRAARVIVDRGKRHAEPKAPVVSEQ